MKLCATSIRTRVENLKVHYVVGIAVQLLYNTIDFSYNWGTSKTDRVWVELRPPNLTYHTIIYTMYYVVSNKTFYSYLNLLVWLSLYMPLPKQQPLLPMHHSNNQIFLLVLERGVLSHAQTPTLHWGQFPNILKHKRTGK